MTGFERPSAITLTQTIHQAMLTQYVDDPAARPSDLLMALVHELAVVIVAHQSPQALALVFDELPARVALLQQMLQTRSHAWRC